MTSGSSRNKVFVTETPIPILEKDPAQPILSGDSLEIARQITLRTWDTWAAIKPWEFLGLAWQKKGKEKTAANVLKMTQQFNHFSAWVSSCVLINAKIVDRVKVVKKFLDIASHLKSLGNFNGIMEIWSGFQRQPVFRMSATFAEVFRDRKYDQIWKDLESLTSQDNNFKTLRSTYVVTNPPVIPYLGMYLSDLVFIEEGNPNKIGDLINYSKCRAISGAIKKIQQYQQKGPALQKVQSILDKLNLLSVLNSEDDMYSISNYFEPREGKEPGPRPPALDSYLAKITVPAKPLAAAGVLKKKQSFTVGSKGAFPPSPGTPRGPATIRPVPISTAPALRAPNPGSRASSEERERAELVCAAAWKGDLEEFRNQTALPNLERVLNLQNSRGQTPLYCAAHEGKFDIVLELLNAEVVDVNFGNSEHGGTALHAASFADQPHIVAALLIVGADPMTKNKRGISARSEARGSTLDIYALWDRAQDDASLLEVLSTFKDLYPEIKQLNALIRYSPELVS